jgi:hypothetical protein
MSDDSIMKGAAQYAVRQNKSIGVAMKQIGNSEFSAPKISKTGNIKYCLWVDVEGALYVQMIENDASGTFSKYFFSVSKYKSERLRTRPLGGIEVYNIETCVTETVNDNNNGAFLRAILLHLLPEK